MCFLSEMCFKHPLLLLLFNRLPQDTGYCSLTKQGNVKVIDGSANEVIMAVRSLTRYYLNEWDYNSHFGGNNDFASLLKENNLFFNFDAIDEEEFESYIDGIVFCEGYYNYDQGISMFAGYNDGHQNTLLQSVGTVTTALVHGIQKDLHDRNLVSLLTKITKIVDLALPIVSTELDTLTLFRARIGVKDKKFVDNLDFVPETHYFPYVGEEIGPSPVRVTSKGRMNREGFSFLYLADNSATAVAEVRPSPGDFVSVGRFIQKGKITIADFSIITIDKFWMNDKDLDMFEALHSISKFISNPLGSTENYYYIFTQLIAEELLRRDINGVCFNSSLTEGRNYTIFQPDTFVYDDGSGEVFKVDKIKTETSPCISGNNKTKYWEFKIGF